MRKSPCAGSARERGQALVCSAYNEQRGIQSTADAAALAGAELLCDELGQTAALDAARNAGQINGATTLTATATLGADARSVHAIASIAADTCFFKLVGVDRVPVSAEATAECSCSASIGGAWPIAFDEHQFSTLGCLNEDDSVTGTSPADILVWVDDNVDAYFGQDILASAISWPTAATRSGRAIGDGSSS
jgi:hypothetical protein